jgi:hypothetical protein
MNLEERFGTEAAKQVRADVQTIEDLTRLERLHRLSVRCTDPDVFRAGLQAEMPARRVSRRGAGRRR